MRLLTRYVLREFLLPLCYCMAGFVAIFVLFELSSSFSRMLEAKLSPSDTFMFFAGYLAPYFMYLAPAALMLATLYTMWNFCRHSEIIAMRGYENYSLTPYEHSKYNSNGYAYAGNIYDKFTVELRYPVILQPSSTIFALAFVEGGNCWSDIRNFNPFQIKRSAGVGVRIYLPMIGLLGVDWGYGFDNPDTSKRSQFHFMIGQQF